MRIIDNIHQNINSLSEQMMKKQGHPDYHKISVVMTDGSKFETRSTWGKTGDQLSLDVDPLSHPAWTGGGVKLLDTDGQLGRFKKRFDVFKLS